MRSEWELEDTGHNVALTKYYKEDEMAGKNGKSKGTVSSVKSVGGGYEGVGGFQNKSPMPTKGGQFVKKGK